MQGRIVQTQNRVGKRDVRNEERDFWQVMKGRVMDRGPWRWGGGWLVAISTEAQLFAQIMPTYSA